MLVPGGMGSPPHSLAQPPKEGRERSIYSPEARVDYEEERPPGAWPGLTFRARVGVGIAAARDPTAAFSRSAARSDMTATDWSVRSSVDRGEGQRHVAGPLVGRVCATNGRRHTAERGLVLGLAFS